jgi:hypothetical protein
MINYSLKAKYDDYSVFEPDAVWSERCLPTFEKSVLPISAEDKSKFLSLSFSLFCFKNSVSTLLRNVGKYIPDNTESQLILQ